MTPEPKPKPRHRAKSSTVGASWLALVAATTLGAGLATMLRARVSLDTPAAQCKLEGHCHRLVVQSYQKCAIDASGMPESGAKPLASMQRAVTGDELRRGVAVDIVQLAEGGAVNVDGIVVLAWVERGVPDLEYDARTARPSAGAMYGMAQRLGSQIEVVLRRTA